MDKYRITAIIEEVDFAKNELQLKGVGKYFFENKDASPPKYKNILEEVNTGEPKFIGTDVKFQTNIPANKLDMQLLLGYAFNEKKRLKFEAEYDKTNDIYSITHISKAD